MSSEASQYVYSILIGTEVTGGAGSVGANIASAVLESGGDAVCFDRAEQLPSEVWGKVSCGWLA